MMTSDEYLEQVLRQATAPVGSSGPGSSVLEVLSPQLRRWGGNMFLDAQLSGSYAKGTAVRPGTDVDVFASLHPNTSNTLEEIYDSLDSFLVACGYATRRQNVSIGVSVLGHSVDITPGKRQAFPSTDHSIWVSKRRTWMQTNVATHIRVIGSSPWRRQMILLKRWKKVNTVDIPSFVVELAVMRALTGGRYGLASGVLQVLDFLAQSFATCALVDPANSNNDVAAEMSGAERRAVVTAANRSKSQQYWKDIVW